MRLVVRAVPKNSPETLHARRTAIKVAQRPQRILDFDIENRPLSYLGSDFTTAEITAIAWAWTDQPHNVEVRLLGQCELPTMLADFCKAFSAADVVTGHYIRCMVPETRVLTHDLRWKPVGDLQIGETLIGFDEHSTGRNRKRLRTATVLSNRPRLEPVFAVELETGEVLYATAEHPWLAATRQVRNAQRFHWRRTDQLLGGQFGRQGQFAKGPALLYRVVEPWKDKQTWDTGWLAGFFDGEGTLGFAGSNGGALQITAVQNPGGTLDHALHLLRANGFDAVSSQRTGGKSTHTIRINGGLNGFLRFLGQIRPERLLRKWLSREITQSLRQMAVVEVRSVQPAGVREISALSTSTRTYIAEGYAVHNSHDLPVVNSALMEFQLPPLTDKYVQDTKIDLMVGKGLSRSQESLAAMLALELDKVQMNQSKWRAANRLTPKGLKEVRNRVAGDVRQHMQLRQKLLECGYLGPPRLWRSRSHEPLAKYSP